MITSEYKLDVDDKIRHIPRFVMEINGYMHKYKEVFQYHWPVSMVLVFERLFSVVTKNSLIIQVRARSYLKSPSVPNSDYSA